MKKFLTRYTVILLSLLFVFQANITAFADTQPDWQDANWTQQEFDIVYYENPSNYISPLTTGLIFTYGISISSSGSNLLIAGKTVCDPDVVKCGFTEVIIKRRTSSSASWTTYKTYEDLYDNSSAYVLSKTISVSSGYQYRVYCTHYAKKNILSTEKIDNYSNIIAI